MFKPVSERIEKLAATYPEKIQELERIFDKKTNVYIDYANVRGWSQKLGWRVDVKRLKQLFNSFDTISEVKFYYGTMKGKAESEMMISAAGTRISRQNKAGEDHEIVHRCFKYCTKLY